MEVWINVMEIGDDRRISDDNCYICECFIVMDWLLYNVLMLVFRCGRVCVLGDYRLYIGGL